MSVYARKRMIALLGEVFNVLDNKDVICPMYVPPCATYLRFSELRGLLSTLNGASPAGLACSSDQRLDASGRGANSPDEEGRGSPPLSLSGLLDQPYAENDWEV